MYKEIPIEKKSGGKNLKKILLKKKVGVKIYKENPIEKKSPKNKKKSRI